MDQIKIALIRNMYRPRECISKGIPFAVLSSVGFSHIIEGVVGDFILSVYWQGMSEHLA